MGHGDYGQAKKAVFKGMMLLGFVTLVEVAVSLFGKGHLGFDPSGMSIVLGIVAFLLIALSIYKAYFIIYEFMHMGHEVQGLRMSVLLPVLLLVWAIIAFFNEGSAWKNNREVIKEKNEYKTELPKKIGMDDTNLNYNDLLLHRDKL